MRVKIDFLFSACSSSISALSTLPSASIYKYIHLYQPSLPFLQHLYTNIFIYINLLYPSFRIINKIVIYIYQLECSMLAYSLGPWKIVLMHYHDYMFYLLSFYPVKCLSLTINSIVSVSRIPHDHNFRICA